MLDSGISIERRTERQYFDANNQLNTMTARCHYQEYDPETGHFSIVHLSHSHMGIDGSGRTSHFTWSGDRKRFEKQNYHETQIVPKIS